MSEPADREFRRADALSKKFVAEIALAELDRPMALYALHMAVTETIIRFTDDREEAREYLEHFVNQIQEGFEPALGAYYPEKRDA